jgi:thiamine monophosphate kinase
MAQQWPARRVRDLSIIGMADGSHLVVACDSIGGIGPKAGDTVSETAYPTGYFAVRTAVLEVLAIGAEPRLIVNNLCFESGTDADTMIAAMVDVAAEVGLDASAVTGSTEDNVSTTTTGIGITVIGSAGAGALRSGRSRPGDLVACLGLPRSAPRYRLTVGEPTMPSIAEVRRALAVPGVREALPVGSAGIAHEMTALADTAGLVCLPASGDLDLHESGGPASCVLVALDPTALTDLRMIRPDLPLAVVGHLSWPER